MPGRYSSCELPVKKTRRSSLRNRLYPFQGNFVWKGIRVERYKPSGDDWSEIIRQTIIGNHGERTDFELRYFEIRPGGYSSLETHRHEHVVIGIRGRGCVRLNRRDVEIGFLDVLYIAPHTVHRLYNPHNEPFGFFCIVDSKRDRPRPVRR
jgi:ribulose-bisphosphate carboxylase large chain